MTYTLTDATVEARSSDLVLTYATNGDEPTTGAVTYSTTFINETGDDVRQVGWKVVDSDVVSVFWTDVNGMQYHAPGDVMPSRVGNRRTIVFPLAALGDIRSGKWHADLAVDQYDRGRVDGTL